MNKIIKYLINTYNFNGVYHFTDFSNLDSILNSGFLTSRHDCESNNIDFTDTANTDIISNTDDRITNSVRFYYKEKSLTLYTNEGIKPMKEDPHLPLPVYLIFNTNLLLENYIYFSDGNARAHRTSFNSNIYLLEHINWNAVFQEGAFNSNDWELKRKKQAEILSNEPVSLELFLQKIVFRSEVDLKRYKFHFSNFNYETVVNESLFNNHQFFITKHNMYYDSDSQNIILKWSLSKYLSNIINYDSKSMFTIIIYNSKKDEIHKMPLSPVDDLFNSKEWSYSIPLGKLNRIKEFTYEFYLFDILVIEDYFIF